jgi:hypothetical protein
MGLYRWIGGLTDAGEFAAVFAAAEQAFGQWTS